MPLYEQQKIRQFLREQAAQEQAAQEQAAQEQAALQSDTINVDNLDSLLETYKYTSEEESAPVDVKPKSTPIVPDTKPYEPKVPDVRVSAKDNNTISIERDETDEDMEQDIAFVYGLFKRDYPEEADNVLLQMAKEYVEQNYPKGTHTIDYRHLSPQQLQDMKAFSDTMVKNAHGVFESEEEMQQYLAESLGRTKKQEPVEDAPKYQAHSGEAIENKPIASTLDYVKALLRRNIPDISEEDLEKLAVEYASKLSRNNGTLPEVEAPAQDIKATSAGSNISDETPESIKSKFRQASEAVRSTFDKKGQTGTKLEDLTALHDGVDLKENPDNATRTAAAGIADRILEEEKIEDSRTQEEKNSIAADYIDGLRKAGVYDSDNDTFIADKDLLVREEERARQEEMGHMTTDEWVKYMYDLGYSSAEIEDAYEQLGKTAYADGRSPLFGFSRSGPKFSAAMEPIKAEEEKIALYKQINDIVHDTSLSNEEKVDALIGIGVTSKAVVEDALIWSPNTSRTKMFEDDVLLSNGETAKLMLTPEEYEKLPAEDKALYGDLGRNDRMFGLKNIYTIPQAREQILQQNVNTSNVVTQEQAQKLGINLAEAAANRDGANGLGPYIDENGLVHLNNAVVENVTEYNKIMSEQQDKQKAEQEAREAIRTDSTPSKKTVAEAKDVADTIADKVEDAAETLIKDGKDVTDEAVATALTTEETAGRVTVGNDSGDMSIQTAYDTALAERELINDFLLNGNLDARNALGEELYKRFEQVEKELSKHEKAEQLAEFLPMSITKAYKAGQFGEVGSEEAKAIRNYFILNRLGTLLVNISGTISGGGYGQLEDSYSNYVNTQMENSLKRDDTNRANIQSKAVDEIIENSDILREAGLSSYKASNDSLSKAIERYGTTINDQTYALRLSEISDWYDKLTDSEKLAMNRALAVLSSDADDAVKGLAQYQIDSMEAQHAEDIATREIAGMKAAMYRANLTLTYKNIEQAVAGVELTYMQLEQIEAAIENLGLQGKLTEAQTASILTEASKAQKEVNWYDADHVAGFIGKIATAVGAGVAIAGKVAPAAAAAASDRRLKSYKNVSNK